MQSHVTVSAGDRNEGMFTPASAEHEHNSDQHETLLHDQRS
jgi:hypothetical protein